MKSEARIRKTYKACRILLDNYDMPEKTVRHLCAITGCMAWILEFKGTHETDEDIKNITMAMEQVTVAAKKGVQWPKKSKK